MGEKKRPLLPIQSHTFQKCDQEKLDFFCVWAKRKMDDDNNVHIILSWLEYQ